MFFERIDDLYRKSVNKNIVTCTKFLTPTQKTQIEMKSYKNIYMFGGNNSSERCRAFFLPDYLSKENLNVDNYISAFRIKFNFEKLNHRDFLGSILGLGIERNAIGDIYVTENEGYFYAIKDISKYIAGNLNKIGRVGVEVEIIDLSEVKIYVPKIEERVFTVQSMRLDGIISGAFNISREESSRLIRLGIVLKNYLICESVSCEVKNEDIISAKGLGKFKILRSNEVSRRGRIFVTIEKYI